MTSKLAHDHEGTCEHCAPYELAFLRSARAGVDKGKECRTGVVNLEPRFGNLTSLVWYLVQLLLSLSQQDKALRVDLIEFIVTTLAAQLLQ